MLPRYRDGMPAPRRALIAAVLLAALVTTAACAPATPDPAPSARTPTPLSDADAFAAAEETYRAYVDALNAVDLSDPTTFEPVFALTTGDLRSESRRAFQNMHDDSWTVAGDSKATHVSANRREDEEVLLDVCLDVSSVIVTDDAGSVVTSEDRRPIQALEVVVELLADGTAFVAATGARQDGRPC